MKILIITAEEWNDYVYGNGVLSNWFSGFDAEFAHIYTSPGLPINHICRRYFRITDAEMAHSLVSRSKAGAELVVSADVASKERMQNAQRLGLYGFMKNVSLGMHTFVQLIRDFIWCNGHYNEEALSKFVTDFNPDVVYCPRYLTPALMRLEKLVSKITNAPIVAFTADDEASYREYSLSPLYWLRRIWVHHKFANHLKTIGYRHYWTFSEDQAQEYALAYGVETSTLYKCADFSEFHAWKAPGSPIRLVYAGRLYCNRWKTLAEIGKALKIINKDVERMVLDIYTTDELTTVQKQALCPENSVYFHGRVTPAELVEIYKKGDISLHVESFDTKYRLVTRVSFSTKIIDLMASTCAILAVCWNEHTGYKYLKKQDAAFCVSNYRDILPLLQRVCDHPKLIQQYAQKAYDCGKRNHSREIIQTQIRQMFEKVINEK